MSLQFYCFYSFIYLFDLQHSAKLREKASCGFQLCGICTSSLMSLSLATFGPMSFRLHFALLILQFHSMDLEHVLNSVFRNWNTPWMCILLLQCLCLVEQRGNFQPNTQQESSSVLGVSARESHLLLSETCMKFHGRSGEREGC